MTEENTQSKHQQKMQKIQKTVAKRVNKATKERGILIVMTGNGKGKTCAGFGNIIRCIGHGFNAGVVQFIKGTWAAGEVQFIQQVRPDMPYYAMKTGFTWDTQDKAADIAAAQLAWQHAKTMLSDPDLKMVLLDELTYMLTYQYLDLEDVLSTIQNRPGDQTVIVTGRSAHSELVAIADTVSEVREEKHAFRDGIKAQQGIDW
ncbi:MAG: cob(I)alamin adenosyltransferase [Moritella sp.]|jgi:cob(I)alamin adenosyltransferase